MYLPFTYAVLSYFIMLLRTFFILVAIAFEAVLASTFINKTGLQYFMSLLSLSFSQSRLLWLGVET